MAVAKWWLGRTIWLGQWLKSAELREGVSSLCFSENTPRLPLLLLAFCKSCSLGGHRSALPVPEAVGVPAKKDTRASVAAGGELSEPPLLFLPIGHPGPFFPLPLNCFTSAVTAELQQFQGWRKAVWSRQGKVQRLHFIDSYLLIPMGWSVCEREVRLAGRQELRHQRQTGPTWQERNYINTSDIS